ncbi:MAG TPA: toll/interleukin-1 receptor domain-containing protein [Pyrinomonadaceae bacterium]|jgi:hypothetical protein|nr:toll/interleukin-1 receptor domain-containing protein [Pyrinomonadaceae bacterium]
MAYVPGFEYDIFISHAALDVDRGWVTSFQEHLSYALARQFGRIDAVKIWCGSWELGIHIYSDEARQGITNSAVFLALTSRAYFKSQQCMQELRWFHQKAQAEPYGLTIGNRSRIFNVRLQDIPPEEWPPELRGMAGFKLYDDDNPFLPVFLPSKPESKVFAHQVYSLAKELTEILRDFRSLAEAHRADPTPPAQSRPTVFLAHAEGRLRPIRRRVAEELMRDGVEVITDIPPPFDSRSHEAAALNTINSADLCVHMLDETPGMEIVDDARRNYAGVQLELGMRHARAQLVWVDAGLDVESIEDDGHRELLRLASNHVAGEDQSYRFVRAPFSELRHLVYEELEKGIEWVTSGDAVSLPAPTVSTPVSTPAPPRVEASDAGASSVKPDRPVEADAPSVAAVAPSRIFICYRRVPGVSHAAGRLYDRLASHFGDERVFMDISAIDVGEDFVEAIMRELSSCLLMLVLIHRGWADAKEFDGGRLHEKDDFVRMEVSAALMRDIRVVPVLLDGAPMPRAEELPEDLRALARRNAFKISGESWTRDVGELLARMERQMQK